MGKGDMRLAAERRVTARKDETQPVILKRSVVLFGYGGSVGLGARDFTTLHLGAENDIAADTIHCLVAPSTDEPRAWIRRHTGLSLVLERCGERFLAGFLGQVEIAEQTDQRCENATRLPAKDFFHLAIDACTHIRSL